MKCALCEGIRHYFDIKVTGSLSNDSTTLDLFILKLIIEMFKPF